VVAFQKPEASDINKYSSTVYKDTYRPMGWLQDVASEGIIA
jgi:hypothetical protein